MIGTLAMAVTLVLALAPQAYFRTVAVAGTATELDVRSSINFVSAKTGDTKGPLQETEVEAALRKSLRELAGPISINILDFSKGSYPPGQLDFPLDGAVPPPISRPACPFLWRGHRLSDKGNSIPVWTRVQVTTKRQLVRTKVGLAAGQVLTENNIETFDGIVCPLLVREVSSPSDYEGLILARSLHSGSQLLPSMVQPPPAVERGTIVPVEALIGRADIRFEAHADRSGYPGQVIELTNPTSGRHFRGVVRSDGSVLVRALMMQRKHYVNAK